MTKTRNFFILGVLLATVVAAAGCADAEKMASELKLVLDTEYTKYQTVTQTLSAQKAVRGERPTAEFVEWTKKLGEVNGGVAAIIKRMANPKIKAKERAGAEAQIRTLQPRLDQLLSREGRISLRFVPSWMIKEATEASERVRSSILDLRRNYETLFKTGAPGTDHWDITIREDKDLYDTEGECQDSLKFFGNGRRDEGCSKYGKRHCGHQMDLRCVDRVLHMNSASDCTVFENVKIGTEVETIESGAAWLSEIARCVSAAPVFKR